MQVNSVNSNAPKFGMAVKVPTDAFDKLVSMMKKNSDWIEFNRIVEKERFNDVADIFVRRKIKSNGTQLAVEVASEEKKVNSVRSLLKQLRKAMKKADKLKEQQDAINVQIDWAKAISDIKTKTDL